MSPAVASLVALLAAIVLSMTTRLNVGLVALVLAWLVGMYDMQAVGVEGVARAFPASLFLTLVGVTALFAAAESNGTLDRFAKGAAGLAYGDARLLGPIFFVMACGVSAVGPGAVPSVALIAPMAMAVGARAGVSPFLIALLVANGANAGNLSPMSAVGVIANTKMASVGLGGHEAKVMLANFAASFIVAAIGFVLFGGLRRSGNVSPSTTETGAPAWSWQHRLTAGIILAWVLSVVFFKWHLGFTALAATLLIVVTRAADEGATLKRLPWGVVLMVSGVSTLVELLNVTGGMDLFTSWLSELATVGTVNAVMAFVTGVISIYSSTAGVVLPAFLPTVPGIIENLGGGDPLALALSVNVGSSLVDVSPLSTLGALCLAAAPATVEARPLFRRLMIWGFTMAFVGAIICQLFAGALARL
jgi:di/tricarboxylate transporter